MARTPKGVYSIDPTSGRIHKQNRSNGSWTYGVIDTERNEVVFYETKQGLKDGKYGNWRIQYRQPIQAYLVGGKIKLGRVKGTRKLDFVELRNTGTSRLDNGFDTLVHRFGLDGVPDFVTNRLRRKWDLLSDNEKSAVFNNYRTETYEKGYGSDAFDERAYMGFDTGGEYAKILEDCIDDELGVPLSERNYTYN